MLFRPSSAKLAKIFETGREWGSENGRKKGVERGKRPNFFRKIFMVVID